MREAARKTECREHLRQLGLAAITHATVHGHFPTGGWGCSWTGDPDRGTGRQQPGGWVYNILPYIEEDTLHDKGSGLGPSEKSSAASQVIQTPLTILNCPTRRLPTLYANAWPYDLYNAASPKLVARADYAINVGDAGSNTIRDGNHCGPVTAANADAFFALIPTADFTGVSFLRSSIKPAQLVDGASHTYLIGESYLAAKQYDTGLIESDRGHMYSGMAPDTARMAQNSLFPSQDGASADTKRFGSAHLEGCNFVFCDGSVKMISYDIDPDAHRRNGNRRDNELTP